MLPPFRLWLRYYSKSASLFVLFLLYFNVFTTKTLLGFTIYVCTLIFGLFPGSQDSITTFELCCLAYASFALGSTVCMYLAFKSSVFTAWCFATIGEERVQKLADRSVFGKFAAVIGGAGAAGTACVAVAIEEGSRVIHNMMARGNAAEQIADINRQFAEDIERAESERARMIENVDKLQMSHVDINERFDAKVAAAEESRDRQKSNVRQEFKEQVSAPGTIRHTVTAIQTVFTTDSETRAAGTVAQAQTEAAKAEAEAKARRSEGIAGATARGFESMARTVGVLFGRSRGSSNDE